MRIAIFALLLPVATAPAAQPERFQTGNGLTVLLHPIEGAKEVALVQLFNIGNDHDPKGRSGMAHLIEHCYVTAAAGKKPSRAYQQLIKRYPKGHNAQTGYQSTVIAFVFEKEKVQEELREAADRMSRLRITREDLLREKPRIDLELQNMFERFPHLAAMNQAIERAFPSPHKGRKGGIQSEIAKITLDQARDYYKKYYRPNNAILVLAGGFDPLAAKKQIENGFSAIPKGMPVPKAPAHGKPQSKLLHLKVKSRLPNFPNRGALAWQVPLPTDKDYPAYLILAARLYFSSLGLRSQTNMLPSFIRVVDAPEVMALQAEAKKGETPDQVMARLSSIASKAIQGKVVPRDRILVQNFFGTFLGLQPFPKFMLNRNLYGVAFALGRQEQLKLNGTRLKKKLEAVTDKDLQRVAKKWLSSDQQGAVFLEVETEKPK